MTAPRRRRSLIGSAKTPTPAPAVRRTSAPLGDSFGLAEVEGESETEITDIGDLGQVIADARAAAAETFAYRVRSSPPPEEETEVTDIGDVHRLLANARAALEAAQELEVLAAEDADDLLGDLDATLDRPEGGGLRLARHDDDDDDDDDDEYEDEYEDDDDVASETGGLEVIETMRAGANFHGEDDDDAEVLGYDPSEEIPLSHLPLDFRSPPPPSEWDPDSPTEVGLASELLPEVTDPPARLDPTTASPPPTRVGRAGVAVVLLGSSGALLVGGAALAAVVAAVFLGWWSLRPPADEAVNEDLATVEAAPVPEPVAVPEPEAEPADVPEEPEVEPEPEAVVAAPVPRPRKKVAPVPEPEPEPEPVVAAPPPPPPRPAPAPVPEPVEPDKKGLKGIFKKKDG